MLKQFGCHENTTPDALSLIQQQSSRELTLTLEQRCPGTLGFSIYSVYQKSDHLSHISGLHHCTQSLEMLELILTVDDTTEELLQKSSCMKGLHQIFPLQCCQPALFDIIRFPEESPVGTHWALKGLKNRFRFDNFVTALSL